MKILIDNGHGNNTSGKRSPDGKFLEAIYTREIAKKLQTDLIDRGYDAELITPEDDDIPLRSFIGDYHKTCFIEHDTPLFIVCKIRSLSCLRIDDFRLTEILRISETEDFQKPKILWKRIGSILRFCYTETELLGLDSTCFLTGSTTEYLCCILNSKMGHYLLKDAPKTGTGDLLISVQAIEPLRIPIISETENNAFKKLINDIHQYASHRVEDLILDKIFNLYQLSDNEKNYIVTMFS